MKHRCIVIVIAVVLTVFGQACTVNESSRAVDMPAYTVHIEASKQFFSCTGPFPFPVLKDEQYPPLVAQTVVKTVKLPDVDKTLTLLCTADGKSIAVYPKLAREINYGAQRFGKPDVIYIYNDDRVYLYDENNNQIETIFKEGQRIQISSDGKYILYTVKDKTADERETWVKNFDTGECFKLCDENAFLQDWKNSTVLCYFYVSGNAYDHVYHIYECNLDTKKQTLLLSEPGQEILKNQYLVFYGADFVRLTDFRTHEVEEYHIKAEDHRDAALRFNSDASMFIIENYVYGMNTRYVKEAFVVERASGKTYELKAKYRKEPYNLYEASWGVGEQIDILCYVTDKINPTQLGFSEVFQVVKLKDK